MFPISDPFLVDISKHVDLLKISDGIKRIDYALLDIGTRRIAVDELGMLACDILSNRCISLQLNEAEFVKLDKNEAESISAVSIISISNYASCNLLQNISSKIRNKNIFLTLPTTETESYKSHTRLHPLRVAKCKDRYFITIGNLDIGELL